MHFTLELLAILVGLAAGTALGLALMRRIRLSRRSGGLVLGSVMLLGVGHVFGGAQEDMVQESEDETKRKKGSQSGDPPSLDSAQKKLTGSTSTVSRTDFASVADASQARK